MPLHDWTRVIAETFHDFRYIWVAQLRNHLNRRLLPQDYYAQVEKEADALRPEIDAYDTEDRLYASKQNWIAVRQRSSDGTVALIYVVSPGDKRSILALPRLLEKVSAALAAKMNVMLLDLHPPTRHDPRGIHAAFWDYAFGEATDFTEPPRATLASYRVESETTVTAYVEPISLGDSLRDLPLFLTPDWYVSVPLDETYRRAWNEFPERWKRVVLGNE